MIFGTSYYVLVDDREYFVADDQHHDAPAFTDEVLDALMFYSAGDAISWMHRNSDAQVSLHRFVMKVKPV